MILKLPQRKFFLCGSFELHALNTLIKGQYCMNFLLTIKQLKRAPLRTTLYGLIMLLLTAFFCVSLNLFINSRKNLQAANDAFTTIGVMELYADVDQYGNVLQAPDDPTFQGHLATRVYGYDIAPIINAAGVKKYDHRARYGAYIPGQYARTDEYVAGNAAFQYDLIRFIYTGKWPLEIYFFNDFDDEHSSSTYTDDESKVFVEINDEDIQIVDSACGITYMTLQKSINLVHPLTTQIWLFPDLIKGQEERLRTDAFIGNAGCYTLEPGMEYIGFVRPRVSMSYYIGDTMADAVMFLEDGRKASNILQFNQENHYSGERILIYSVGNEEISQWDFAEDQPFWLYKYEDVLADDHLREYFENAWEAYKISAYSYAVMATDDAMGVPMFHLGNAFMREGRMITPDEFASGAKVCIISAKQAKMQNWNIGDKLPMSFYEDNYMTAKLTSVYNTGMVPTYTKYASDLFGSGEYEIVGIYDTRKLTGESSLTEETLTLPWNMLILPKASIEDAPREEDRPINGALFTLWLENGKIDSFLNEMDALGIMKPKVGEYNAKFTFYDQGYSKIMPSLQTLNGIAELLLILSSALLGIAALLLGFFYVSGERKNIGVMRLLGCIPKQTFTGSMQGALLCAGTGSLVGTLIGLALTEIMSASILNNTMSNLGRHAAFSAFLATGQQAEIHFATHANILLGLIAFGVGFGLFLISAAAFMLYNVSQPPRALLAQEQK